MECGSGFVDGDTEFAVQQIHDSRFAFRESECIHDSKQYSSLRDSFHGLNQFTPGILRIGILIYKYEYTAFTINYISCKLTHFGVT